ncbi:MAG: coproporphyrinogen III oxidase [Alphaproteobacteria bacterium]|nr:coproporphyrinogen III oxidase [Alphaproteobacteria bacterium]
MPAGDSDPRGFGLYVHWPFCLSKCPYCDFNSHVRDGVEHARWRHALLAELDYFAGPTGGRRLTSIFFGGGTPSLMEPATVAALIVRAGEHWDLADDIEITLETNPTSVERERLGDFRDAGINRVSLGVQALDDDALRFLGRGHSVAEALAAVDLAANLFDRHSFDLIYARPGQSVAAWRRELDRAIGHAGEHLSLYQLTIEPGTPFFQAHRRGALAVPDGDHAAALYEATQAALESAGRPAYEISNHAAPGGESRHNLTYWRYGDYVGVGPGAHGRLSGEDGKRATRQHPAPERWLAEVEAAGHASQRSDAVDPATRRAEMTMMGLRLRDGIRRTDFSAETGLEIEDGFPAAALEALLEGGFLMLDSLGLRATAAGRQRLDAVLPRLLV